MSRQIESAQNQFSVFAPPTYRRGNKLVVASTGMGKSHAEVFSVMEAALSAEVAIVVMTAHFSDLCWKAFKLLVAYGLEDRILYDQLNHFREVLTYEFIPRSSARDPFRRAAEIDLVARHFIDILSRRRDAFQLSKNPQTEENTLKAVLLLLHQDSPTPPSQLKYAYRPGTSEIDSLIAGCTDRELQHHFQRVIDGTIKAGTYASAKRLIDAVCDSPAFALRCGNTFNLPKFLDQKGILLVEGGPGVSADSQQTVMNTIELGVIQYIRNRQTKHPTLLVLDEANNTGLIGAGGHEIRAMNELQKFGLDIHVLVQTPSFPTSFITDSVLQNCTRHEYFGCSNSSVAQMAASDLGSPDYKTQIMKMRRGVRLVKERGGRVTRETVPPLPDPWPFAGLSTQKAFAALHTIRQRPEYRRTSCTETKPKTNAIPPSNVSSNSLSNTSSSLPTSSASSPAERLRTARSVDLNETDASAQSGE